MSNYTTFEMPLTSGEVRQLLANPQIISFEIMRDENGKRMTCNNDGLLHKKYIYLIKKSIAMNNLVYGDIR